MHPGLRLAGTEVKGDLAEFSGCAGVDLLVWAAFARPAEGPAKLPW